MRHVLCLAALAVLAASPAVAQTPIFADGFESGDTSMWSATVPFTSFGFTSVTASAAMTGAFGLAVGVDNVGGAYVQDDTPSAETTYRARFQFDPNGVGLAMGETHPVFAALNGTGQRVVAITLGFDGTAYEVRAEYRTDAGATVSTGFFDLNVGPNLLEVEVRAASAPGANDGLVRLFVNGAAVAVEVSVDNDTQTVERARLGLIATGGLSGSTSGTEYFDTFESFRSLRPPQAFTLTGSGGWRTLATPYPDLPLGGREPGYLQPIFTAGYVGAQRDQRDRRGLTNVYLYDETSPDSAGAFVPPERAEITPHGRGLWVYAYDDADSFTPGIQGGFPHALQTTCGGGPCAPFASDYTFAVTYSPGTYRPGINLVGNPYDEAIDWDAAGWTKTNIAPTVYVYDPAYNGGDYRTWDGAAGALTDGIIPAGQGFHVETTGPGPALTVPASARTGVPGTLNGLVAQGSEAGAGKRSGGMGSARSESPVVRFRLAGEVGGARREVEASVGIGEGTGARGLDGLPGRTALRLFAVDGGDARSVAWTEGREIGLHAEAMANGAASQADAVLSWEGAPGLRATLVDRQTGERHDLSRDGHVSLSIRADDALVTPRGELHTTKTDALPAPPSLRPLRIAAGGASRFSFVVEEAGALPATPDLAFGLSLPLPNPARGVATFRFTLPEATDVRLVLYDALGREVAVLADGVRQPGTHAARLDVAALPAGVYLVRLAGGADVAVQRLTVVQ